MWRKRAHGYFAQEKQNSDPTGRSVQFLILQTKQWRSFWGESTLQPTHLFRSRRYARQVPQFIPQGAMRIAGILV